ncbi:hypothetical protein GALMADRAFT_245941 [Galerina marginata CBS 339.88]|uniref:Uncharacterized protein n=1 Tax=Galerina marginata (strain CBS 339.88) TaxID=685588 RepID=A0A067T649_GALM3|nr:hypothetical protein GALMADRAFT_245941 [Galerina marginata CBS 339.88]
MRFLTLFLTAVTLTVSINATPVALRADIDAARMSDLQARTEYHGHKKPTGSPYRRPNSGTGPKGQYLPKPTDAHPNTSSGNRSAPRRAGTRAPSQRKKP